MNLLTDLFTSKSKSKTVSFAVIGLGNFAQTAILPAFANAADKAELAALVSVSWVGNEVVRSPPR